MKSPKPSNKAQRKVDYKNYNAITMRRNYDTKLSATRNYEEKLSQEIMRRNYYRKLSSRKKCVNYRDNGLSKNY